MLVTRAWLSGARRCLSGKYMMHCFSALAVSKRSGLTILHLAGSLNEHTIPMTEQMDRIRAIISPRLWATLLILQRHLSMQCR